MEIKDQLMLNISKRRIDQNLNDNEVVANASRDAVPRLLKRHKAARIQFVEKFKAWSKKFRKVIFSDDKNLV